jgi:septal ring factor EnvC (AmiA/AmiB activator)
MITEAVVLACITVIGGGVLAIGNVYIEGQARREIEEIKSRAEHLEVKLAESETETIELKAEIDVLEKDILDLEARIERWKQRYWRLQVDSQELKMVFLRVMEKADIPTDQFEALIKRIKEDGGLKRQDGIEWS